MKYLRSPIILYTVLLTLYYILTMIFPNVRNSENQGAGRIFPQIIMGMLGLVNLLLVFKNINKLYKSAVCRVFLIYLLMSLIYVFFPIAGRSIYDNLLVFLKSNMAILTLFTFIYFFNTNRQRATRCMFFIFYIQCIYSLESLLMDKFMPLTEDDILDSNAGFNLIAAVPMTLLLPNKRLRLYAYVIMVLACMVSGQRSAALAALISVPFCIKYLRASIKKKDIYIFIFCGSIAIVPIISASYSNMVERMAVDAARGQVGSGRSVFWALLLIDFFQHNFFHILFGNGYFSSNAFLASKYGMAIEAHSGWIQNLYLFGIFGLILYSRTVFVLKKQNKYVNRLFPEYRNIFLICFIIFIVKCTTSHGNWDISVMPFSLVIAYIASQYNVEKNKAVRK